jgi:hypothetical protein
MEYGTIFDDSDDSNSSMDISFDNDDDSENSSIISYIIHTIHMETDIKMDIPLDNDDNDEQENYIDFVDSDSIFSDTTTSSMSSSESLED